MLHSRLPSILLGLCIGLQSSILAPVAAAQDELVLLTGDGQLGPEADSYRGISSAYGYEGTPHTVVTEMIELAGVSEDDVAYEPGCGDARIVIAAVQAGAKRGLGVEINPDLAEVCYERVNAAGLDDQIEIYWGNALDLDISEVTTVFLFMGNSFNMVMRPMLWEQLPIGARVVSNDFHMRDWEPDETLHIATPDHTYVLYLWTITAEIKEKLH